MIMKVAPLDYTMFLKAAELMINQQFNKQGKIISEHYTCFSAIMEFTRGRYINFQDYKDLFNMLFRQTMYADYEDRFVGFDGAFDKESAEHFSNMLLFCAEFCKTENIHCEVL